MYKNCKTTLNYFTLALFHNAFEIAKLIQIEIYRRTSPYNFKRYRNKGNDELYQKTINPSIKIQGKEFTLIQYFL